MLDHALVVTLIAALGLGAAVSANPADTIDPEAYFGVYKFGDGVVVSGGRMDEGGQSRLVYMDTATVSRGAALKPAEDGFVPAFGISTVERVAFSDDAGSMRWHMTNGDVLEAQRTVQPGFVPAHFHNGEVALSGTLYLPPEADAPLPAVVLGHGSGPTTRFAGTWITFFVQQGMAVLSYDKRGTGASTGNWQTSTYLDLVGDLSAAIDWLKQQPQIDARRIGLHTSSQSGWFGPLTALKNETIAFLIQRVGPAVNIGVGTGHEIQQEWRAEGIAESNVQPAVQFWLQLHNLAARNASLAAANAKLEEARQNDWFAETFENWDEVDADWWQTHTANMQIEPARDVAALDIPVLWFLADRDQNVPYEASINALEKAQTANDMLEIVTVRNSPHSFLVPDGEGGVRYTDQYWNRMAKWLREIDVL